MPMIEEKRCRRCGAVFLTDGEAEMLVCEACQWLDWHEAEDELPEHDDE